MQFEFESSYYAMEFGFGVDFDEQETMNVFVIQMSLACSLAF